MNSFKLKVRFLTILVFSNCAMAMAQLPAIYKDGFALAQPIQITSWGGTQSVSATTAYVPYQGANHYQITYNGSSVFGLNLDGFYKKTQLNFSAYSLLRIAYRGLDANDKLEVRLRDCRETVSGTMLSDKESNTIRMGDPTTLYQIVEIPLSVLLEGAQMTANAVSEIRFDINAATTATNKTMFIDNVELDNVSLFPTAAETMTRYAALKKGFNACNWLEASWKLPDNYVSGITNGYAPGTAPYPVVGEYSRETFRALKNAGFDHVRLPVIFEHLANQIPPYDFKTDAVAVNAFNLVTAAVSWAQDFDMKIILDNHNNLNDNLTGLSSNLTNHNYVYLNKINFIKAVWKNLITRYKEVPASTLLFEISNEPHGITNNSWRTLTEDLIKNVIRPIETPTNKHTFLIGGNDYSSVSGLMALKPINDTNIIYTFHCYEPYAFTHQGLSYAGLPTGRTYTMTGTNNDHDNLVKSFNLAKKWSQIYNNVPIYLGKLGVSVYAAATERCKYIQDIMALAASKSIPWAYWDVKGWDDSFGIFQNPNNGSDHSITKNNLLSCFKTNMGLYTCDAPSNLVLTNLNVNAPMIQWTAGSTNTNSYNIEYKLVAAATWTKISPTLATPTYFFAANLLQFSQTYLVRISALCSNGNRLYSNELQITTGANMPCTAPTNLVASSIGANSMLLSWTPSAATATYWVEYSSYGTPFTSKAITGSQPYLLTGLLPNDCYSIRIKVVCGASTFYSAPINPTTIGACDVGMNFSIGNSLPNPNFITLSWARVSERATYFVQYRKLTEANFTSVQVSWQPNATIISHQLTGLWSNTAYEIRIKTICQNCIGTVMYTNYSSATLFTTPTFAGCILVPPSNVSLSNATRNSLKVNWTQTAGVTATYSVEYTPQNQNLWKSVSAASSPVTLTLNPATTYVVQVRTICNGASSTPSNLATGRTLLQKETSNESDENVQTMDIAPNPTTGAFKILFALKEWSEVEVALTDVTGKVLFTEKIALLNGSHDMDIESLPSGVYFVKAMVNQKELLVKKVVK
jgi:endoglucanase